MFYTVKNNNSSIEVCLKDSKGNLKESWEMTEFELCPSSLWEKLLKEMQTPEISDKKTKIEFKGNSELSGGILSNDGKNLVLSFFITGDSNECNSYYSRYFEINKMIPLIKDIIEIIKDIEEY